MSAYNPTLWIDYETPVNAKNLNKSEAGISQQSTDISVLSEYVTILDNNLNTDIGLLSGYVAELDNKVTDDVSILSDYVTSIDDKVINLDLEINVQAASTSPIKENVEAWIDTSDISEITNSIQDTVLDEIRSILKFMQSEIVQLKAKNVELESRVYYLEQNIGVIPPIPPTSEFDILVFEDGNIMTFEDGSIMIFESDDIVQITGTNLTFEDGNVMIFEDGTFMTFEDEEQVTPSNNTILKFENDDTMLFEDNSIMIFESYDDIESRNVILTFEDLNKMVFENGDLLIFEQGADL